MHRDIKPSNIVIDASGKPRLLDFGIAKLLDDTAAVPVATQAMLTPDYAAPEQLDGDEASVATDVYALGVLLYELVTGTGPWRREGASVPAIIRRVLYDDPALPSRAARATGAPVPCGAHSRRSRRDHPEGDAARARPTAIGARSNLPRMSRGTRRSSRSARAADRRGYMLGRFVRRYRWATAATAAALVAC
jgi:serine/threonine protein kinase